MLSLGSQWFLHIPQVQVWISLELQLRLVSLHGLLKCTVECTNCVCKSGLLEASSGATSGTANTDCGRPALSRGGVTLGGCTQVPNPRCIYPNTVRVLRPCSFAFTMLFGDSVAEHVAGEDRVSRNNTFLESPFDSYFFVC